MTAERTADRLGDIGPVPWPPRVKVPHGLTSRELEVVRVQRLTPLIVRVTFGGSDLAGFASLGPTGHVKILFPDDRGTHMRDYTARTHRADGLDAPEIDVDLVLHGDTGPASAWAARAAVGQRLAVAGPKSSKLLPDGATSVLLGCDETALPATARWLEMLPADVPVRVLAEVGSAEEETYLDALRARPGLDLRWLHRSGAREATGLLEEAVRRAGPIDRGTFVWFAGEAGSLVGVRRYLRRELGLPAAQVELTGYWRRGQAHFDHHAPLDPQDPD